MSSKIEAHFLHARFIIADRLRNFEHFKQMSINAHGSLTIRQQNSLKMFTFLNARPLEQGSLYSYTTFLVSHNLFN